MEKNQAKKMTELQLGMLATTQPPLSEFVEVGLKKQFDAIQRRLELLNDVEETCKLTDILIRLAQILDPSLRQNQSFFGANSSHPYVLQIPAQDLLALYAARAAVNYSANHDTKKAVSPEEYIRQNLQQKFRYKEET